MKYQSQFSGDNKKNISVCRLLNRRFTNAFIHISDRVAQSDSRLTGEQEDRVRSSSLEHLSVEKNSSYLLFK